MGVCLMPFHVLLVEDNPGDVQIARAALAESDLDCALHVVRDGIDAELFLKKAGEFRQAPTPDLVILDWRLPFREGQAVLNDIRKDQRFDAIPITVYSSSNAPPDVTTGYDSGGNCWVTKPSNLDDQFRAICGIVRYWKSVAERSKSDSKADATEA
jgi:chemotaxis family two-component system response regulator Rcp1